MRTRAFTILELVSVMVIAGVLAAVAFAAYNSVASSSKDATAKQLLLSLAPAQALRYGSVEAFASSPQEASRLYQDMAQTTFVAGDADAQLGQVSIAAGVEGATDFDALALATRAESGLCVTAILFEPDAGKDVETGELPSTSRCSADLLLADSSRWFTPPSTASVLPPSDLRASAGKEAVTVRFTPDPGLSYTLGISCLSEDQCSPSTVDLGGSGFYTHAPLTAGVTYLYSVTANSPTGDSETVGPVSATPYGDRPAPSGNTTNVEVPGPPLNLTASPGDKEVDLSWSGAYAGSSPVRAYIVQYRDSADGSWRSLDAPLSPSTTSTTVTNLVNGTTYDFRVRARSSAGLGAWSNIVSATPQGLPSEPRNLQGVPDTTSVALTWDAPAQEGASVTGYVVSYKLTTDPTWTRLSPVAARTLTVSELSPATSYDFKVAAVNPAGEGPATSPISVTTTGSAPSKVENLAGTPTASRTVTLTWDPVATATDYIVEYKLNTASNWTVFSDQVTDVTGAVVNGLTNNRTYEFRVAAVNASGPGPYSDTATVVLALPSAPLGFSLERTSGGSSFSVFRASWNPPATPNGAITRYQVRCTVVSGPTTAMQGTLTVNNGNTFSTTLTTTSVTTVYSCSVRASNPVGWGPYSNAVLSTASKPAAPVITSVSLNSPSSVLLSWTPGATNGTTTTGYLIEYQMYSQDVYGIYSWSDWGNALSGSVQAPANVTSYTINPPNNGYLTRFRVTTLTTENSSDPSALSDSIWIGSRPSAPTAFAYAPDAAFPNDLIFEVNPPSIEGSPPFSAYIVQLAPVGTSNWFDFLEALRFVGGANQDRFTISINKLFPNSANPNFTRMVTASMPFGTYQARVLVRAATGPYGQVLNESDPSNTITVTILP